MTISSVVFVRVAPLMIAEAVCHVDGFTRAL
jgi:hypothetical protein